MPHCTATSTIKDSVGGAGFHEYRVGRRGAFEDFRGPFVNFLEGVFVGYGSEEYNELCPCVV